mmetsp:Transcript_14064/g.21060  ORF Transcript_14064/g.21060 Transcript_14064/m.21060 type:complete len:187 (+) Transcript_14064:48-608(+)
MKLLNIVALLSLAGSSSAYSTSTSSRRELISNVAKGALFGIGAVAIAPSAEALEMCPPKANNCVRTAWTPPAGVSKNDAVLALRDALNAYPQAGQDNVDGGGWVIVEDDLAGSGAARLEYKSSGKGNFAKFFNGGKAFVDDLKLEVDASGVVNVKSQSRVGDSDFGVNKKRTDYIGSILAAKGWAI